MAHKFVFGEGLVAHSAGVLDNMPTIVMCPADYVEDDDLAGQLMDKEHAVIIQMKTIEGAFGVIDMVFQSVVKFAAAVGVDPNAFPLPIVTIEDHQKAIDAKDRRIVELLEANNRYLQRARDAEGMLHQNDYKRDILTNLNDELAKDHMTLDQLSGPVKLAS